MWLACLEKDALESLVKCSKEQHDFHASEVITLRYLTHAITQPSFEETQAKYKGAQ
jgi:prephenate dehydrogenase